MGGWVGGLGGWVGWVGWWIGWVGGVMVVEENGFRISHVKEEDQWRSGVARIDGSLCIAVPGGYAWPPSLYPPTHPPTHPPHSPLETFSVTWCSASIFLALLMALPAPSFIFSTI